jgi:hypothetical protein
MLKMAHRGQYEPLDDAQLKALVIGKSISLRIKSPNSLVCFMPFPVHVFLEHQPWSPAAGMRVTEMGASEGCPVTGTGCVAS